MHVNVHSELILNCKLILSVVYVNCELILKLRVTNQFDLCSCKFILILIFDLLLFSPYQSIVRLCSFNFVYFSYLAFIFMFVTYCNTFSILFTLLSIRKKEEKRIRKA